MEPDIAIAVAWGDVGTWFAGIVGTAAVVLSAISVRISAKAVRISAEATASAAESAHQATEMMQIERSRFEREEVSLREQQARNVSCRLVWRQASSPGERLVEHQYFVIANHSTDRVTDLTVHLDCPQPADIVRPLDWSAADVDVISVPMSIVMDELEPSGLAGPTEIRVQVLPTPGLDPADEPGQAIRIRWVPRPPPFAAPAPRGLDDPKTTTTEALDLFREYDRRLRPLSEPDPPAGPERERARYEHVVALLNRGRGRSGSRTTGGATRWAVELTDMHGVRWRRTPEGLAEANHRE